MHLLERQPLLLGIKGNGVDDRERAVHRAAHRWLIAQVRGHVGHSLGGTLRRRVPGRDANGVAPRGQCCDDFAAEETGAAEDRYRRHAGILLRRQRRGRTIPPDCHLPAGCLC